MLGDEDFDANVVFYGRQVPICCLSDLRRYNHFQFDQRLQEVTALHSEIVRPFVWIVPVVSFAIVLLKHTKCNLLKSLCCISGD